MQQPDDIARRIQTALADRGLEKRYGRHAVTLLRHLPALYRLLTRVTFDVSMPLAARQLAAQAVVYVAEPEDFLGRQHGKELIVDDAWVAFRVLERLARHVSEEKLSPHWREDDALRDVIALANNLDVLEKAVPSRVLTLLHAYLGEPA